MATESVWIAFDHNS